MVTKGFKKKKSKRISSKMTRKVDKKVKEHNKKKKRESKKNPGQHKAKKDPGVPNSLPFKDEVLAEIAEKKRKDFEKKKQKKLRQADNRKKGSLESLVKDAGKRSAEFDAAAEMASESSKDLNALYDNSLKAYYREVKKVIEASDVILEILDARDPVGTRCAQLEQNVMESGPNKRLVLVLNKCDLIPKENLLVWLKYLRQEFPTIAFKASTQSQKSNLSRSRVPVHLASADLIKTSACFGSSMLMKILGNYCRSRGVTTAIRVGVVGLPNVGKSSVINSLKRKQSCGVGATPGVTKTMQEIHLDKHVTLLDSPGVVFTKEGDDVLAALRNTIKVDSIPDPVQPVEMILKKCSKLQLMVYYKLPDFDDSHQFLALVAMKRGLLKKGGIPDMVKAARLILQDWTGGKIAYYTTPPEKRPEEVHIKAELVTAMSKEFDLDALEDEEKMMIDEMPAVDSSKASALQDNSEDDNMGEEEDEEELVPPTKGTSSGRMVVNLEPVGKKGKAGGKEEDDWESDDSTKQVAGNQQWSKHTKKALKRRLKLKTKRDKTTSAMADKMASIMTLGLNPTSMEE
ncbi:Guanine nucleotide-binding protein-like 3-like protein [Hypsibius exemplaris]|uniref:Guanine nucleotide-binding protein-like 3 homolog n=1 Tax=Hypsibius exemplaris TaxID=2072580 RepID=A0A1W0X8J3_HYPEX|nr:Guanine nucleotide-binding protein-like 3-like protein [Hypsibius exemplaris]